MFRLIGFLGCCALLSATTFGLPTAELRLELVQVLFRHGERTPRAMEMYPNDPYNVSTYEPYGLGQLTNAGKMREYRIGKMLRDRYGDFLGDDYRPADLYAVSTDVDRTKMSLLLVLAALYPGLGDTWNKNLSWTPVPIHYTPEQIDVYMKPHACPHYQEALKQARRIDAVKRKIEAYDGFVKFLAEKTGITDLDISMVYEVYNLLISQKSMNLELPGWCTDAVYRKIQKIVELEYEIRSYTTELKRINGGMLVRKFIENLNVNGTKDNPRKMYLYSGHEVNVAALAKAHRFTEPKLPNYGSAIIFEKLTDENGKLFVQMLLWTGTTEKLIPYEFPKCGRICPIEDYLEYTRDVIPSDKEMSCLWDSITKEEIRKLFEEKIDPN